MKKHLLITVLLLAFVLCFSFGVAAAADESGYVNDYTTSGLDQAVTEGNVTIQTVAQWREANNITDKAVTFFDGGEAISDDDIIITNKEAAIVLSVGTRNPWGYPSGSVLDVGVVKDGAGVRDTTWSIEFLADWWDSWAPDNCGIVKFEIVNYDFGAGEQKAVKVTRMYDLPGSYGAEGQNNDKKLEIVSYYGAPQEGSYLYMFDNVENKGEDAVWYNGYEGYTGYQGTGDGYENIAWSVTNKGDDGGAMFGLSKGMANHVIGSYANTKGKEGYAFQGEYLTAYVQPESTFISNQNNEFVVKYGGGKSGYQEMYAYNSANDEVEASGNRKMFDVGESVLFKGYIVTSDVADFNVLNKFIADQQESTMAKVTVAPIAGATGDAEIIVNNKDGRVGWYTIDAAEGGSFDLPAGEYSYFVEKAGYTDSDKEDFTVTETGASIAPALGTEKVTIKVKVVDQKGNPLFAKVGVYNSEGVAYKNSLYPVIRYCGDSVFQTKGAKTNPISVQVPKGEVSWLKVFGEGYFFTSKPVEYELKAEDAVADKEITVEVNETFTIQDKWFGSDFHHHTNKNDAFALPEDVVNSFLVSDLDMIFTTDHDFTVNNNRTYNYIQSLNTEGMEALAYTPSVEISCAWAHFNVVANTEEGWDYFLDENADNAEVKNEDGIQYNFTNLPYFIKELNGKGVSVTANHPWYSYGLFTALGKDAVPGGYVDDYDMLGLNGSYRDQEMTKTIKSGTDLWDGYLDNFMSGEGKAKINGVEVNVENTHYFAGGSDTHDVLTPYATNTAETSEVLRENREEFYTGKVRSYAYAPDLNTEGDEALKQNSITFNNAMINGNSYTTTGPLLNLSTAPGNGKNGNVNVNNIQDDGSFDLTVGINSLNGIRDIIVMTDEGESTYDAYIGKSSDPNNKTGFRYKRAFNLSHVDADLSIANGIDGETETSPTLSAVNDKDALEDPVTEYELNLKYEPTGEGLHWVAVCAIDIYNNFAVTNAYWVADTFSDIKGSTWYVKPIVAIQNAGIINGYTDGSFKPNGNLTRAEFASMVYKALGNPENGSTEKTFSDVKEGQWYYKAVMAMATNGYINGYENGTFQPNKKITRAEIAQILFKAFEIEDGDQAATFSDVKANAWYAAAVKALASNGIINGYPDGTFGPSKNTTRAEAAQVIYNMIAGGFIE